MPVTALKSLKDTVKLRSLIDLLLLVVVVLDLVYAEVRAPPARDTPCTGAPARTRALAVGC